jgi:hypothetical protein
MLMAGVAYTILQAAIIAHEGPGSKLKAAVGRDLKGKLSAALYAAAIPCFHCFNLSSGIHACVICCCIGLRSSAWLPSVRCSRR